MNNVVRHYMQPYLPGDGYPRQTMDLERDFPGLTYLEATGLSNLGEVKNIYIEEYAESSEKRVYIPETVTHETGDVKMRFLFTGEDLRDTYDSFCKSVSGTRIRYWDTARWRVAEMVLTSAVDIDEDVLKGGKPYMIAEFSFTLIKPTYPLDYSISMYLTKEPSSSNKIDPFPSEGGRSILHVEVTDRHGDSPEDSSEEMYRLITPEWISAMYLSGRQWGLDIAANISLEERSGIVGYTYGDMTVGLLVRQEAALQQ